MKPDYSSFRQGARLLIMVAITPPIPEQLIQVVFLKQCPSLDGEPDLLFRLIQKRYIGGKINLYTYFSPKDTYFWSEQTRICKTKKGYSRGLIE